MGCGASTQPIPVEQPEQDVDDAQHAAEVKAAEHAPQALKVDTDGDGNGDGEQVIVVQRKGGKFEKEGPFLPFCRFDISAVPKELFTDDHVYISHVRSGKYFLTDGAAITCTAESIEAASVFVFEREDKDAGSPVTDGDWVKLRHYETGHYLTCVDDSSSLFLEPRRERGAGNEMQLFNLAKYGRPMRIRDEDQFFLESWLSNYIEPDTGCEETPLLARRWHQGKHQKFTFRKKNVLEAQTTDVARAMQFQSFDLDGNALITKSELGFMLHQVGMFDQLDDIMAAMDTEGAGGGTKASFKAWADSGAVSEETLQHIECLGNIAQRCNDCCYEERCVIEVLATIPTELVQPTWAEYNKLTGKDLKEELIAKTGSPGYIFSNWWQLAMTQLLVDPVNAWCQALQDAMDGWGTDENTLTALVCTIPEEHHAAIHAVYAERKGKTLLEHIESETSFSYKKVLLKQANTLANARCEALHSAMVGMGTDENQIVRIITACDAGERKELIQAYEQAYNRSLVEHIESEVSGDFKKVLHAIFTTEESPYDLDADCEALKAAMDGWGTDEEALIKLLCSKTFKQMQDIRNRFHEKYGKRLEDRVHGETSGYFQNVLMGLIRDPISELAHAVNYCIAGFGTDETGLITLLSHLPEYKRVKLQKEYKRLFKRDLLDAIKGDTSGDFQNALLACVKLPPQVWAEALTGAMKGLGTADSLLINFMCLSKDYMDEVRAEFEHANGKPLWKWIDGDCSGDYKNTLIALAQRNSEDRVEMLPIYWAQRLRDALEDVHTLKDILAHVPAMVLERASGVYAAVYQESLADSMQKKMEEGKGFSFFTNWWKMAMLRLLEMPVSIRVVALHDAMDGLGTDEYNLTALIMTIPENTHQEVMDSYQQKYGRDLVEHIESETSFAYKKILRYATLSKVESRCVALRNAMEGMGTDEGQLIRIIACASFKERELIMKRYEEKYDRNLIANIESETSGHFKMAMVAMLESNMKNWEPDYEDDVRALTEAMDGVGTDEDELVRRIASKSDDQLETLCQKFEEISGNSLLDRVNGETWDSGMFTAPAFRELMLTLLYPKQERLARCVRHCMEGWGTDDTGLITCLVHLPEADRLTLISNYRRIFDRDPFDDIKSETSGDYEEALLACLRPQCETYVRALRSTMKGFGTSDNLLINWMVLGKDRMDEIREAFGGVYEGECLDSWIDGDCGDADYKDTLLRVARRACLKFPGVEVACTAQAPPSMEDAVLRFNKTFNALCKKKKESGTGCIFKEGGERMKIPEQAQQELGCAFLFWGAKSSCKPNLDMPGLWDMTNAIGFPPADDQDDLRATFREWNISGSGEIDWNDFVHEMTTRINDSNHYDAEPLREE